MNCPYKTYAVVTRLHQLETSPEQQALERYLATTYPRLQRVDLSDADLILVFGGDGTVLETVRSTKPGRSAILSFNTGHRGFLCTVREPELFTDTLDRALNGELDVLSVAKMQVKHLSKQTETTQYAMNEVFVECPMVWLTMEIYTGQAKPTRFTKHLRGSGLCICSALGSTTPLASHLHAPLMDPSLRVFYVKGTSDAQQPAAGLLLSGEEQTILVKIVNIETNHGIPEEHRHPPGLFVDGLRVGTIEVGDSLEISYVDTPSRLLCLPEESRWDRLRQTL